MSSEEGRATALKEHGPCKKCGRAKYDHHSPYEYAALLADQAAGCDGFFEPMNIPERLKELHEEVTQLRAERDASVKAYDNKIIDARARLEALCPHEQRYDDGLLRRCRLCEKSL